MFKNQQYEANMLCIDKLSKYCALVQIKGKTENDLALGFIECMNKMGGPPKVIMTDGEGAIHDSSVFKRNPRKTITYIPSKGHTMFAERMIKTFREMLGKRIKPDQQWTD